VTSQAGCTAKMTSLSALTTNGELAIKRKVLSYLRMPSNLRLRQCPPSACEEPAPLASFFFASDSVRGNPTGSSASNAWNTGRLRHLPTQRWQDPSEFAAEVSECRGFTVSSSASLARGNATEDAAASWAGRT
jgi:hypothetical protein